MRSLSEEWLALAGDADSALRDFVTASLADPRWGPVLAGIFSASPFLSELALANPATVMAVARDGADPVLARAVAGLAAPEASVPAIMTRLRRAKAEAALAIALADLAGLASVEQVTVALSDFADACVRAALRTLLLRARDRGHIALHDTDDPELSCGYAVVGLGKLGGRELNYSSDIDLFVFYDQDRLAYTGPKSPQEFAVSLTKDLVQVLQERKDGYVFRTDLRLRPDPGSTSIAVSRAAAQTYYENYGQNWERAAFIKARPVAGDLEMARSFLRDLQPFIWRKSLDFYAIQDIHSIKRQIYAHKGGGHVKVAGHNIKLGRGGIREIEFFAQIQQLIWGGRFPETRLADTLGALDVLAKLGFVGPQVRDDLKDCYRALRSLEHRLQMIADEQTQTMPSDGADLARLAAFCGADETPAFMGDVEKVLRTVETHYAGLFEDAPSLAIAGALDPEEGGNLVFTGTEDDPDTIATLKRIGYAEPATISQTVRAWHHGRYRATRSNRARQLLTEMMPALLSAFARTTQPDAAFLRFDKCLAALPAGVPLLSVFHANPDILGLVAEIMGDAPRLAEHVTRTPHLLDYVLEPQFFSAIPDAPDLARDLESSLADTDSFEGALDRLRRWTHDQQFRIGVHALRGLTDPLRAAEQLSDVAETVIGALLPRVHEEFARQHGRIEGPAATEGLAVLAYGKLASRELTPSSDLDLVLIYDASHDAVSHGGAKSFPAAPYYIRLAQRVITAFTALTGEGSLYAVDLRLRPNGDKGPLATSLTAFAKYQTEDAWTWEHMALARARVVHGAPALVAAIENAVVRTLDDTRDPDILVCAVADMRALMRKEQGDKGLWDLKRHPGGLIDAEFILQYLALRHGFAAGDGRPAPLISALTNAGALSAADATALAAAVNLWSRLQFMIRLTTEGDVAPEHLPLGLKQKLARTAGVKDDGALERLMAETFATVSALFDKIISAPAQIARAALPPGVTIR